MKRLLLLDDKPDGTLMIHEIYRSLQGESKFTGLPCVFVRLAVCDSRCSWCDTPHAFNQGEVMSLDSVVEQVRAFDCGMVLITGGEPLLQAEVLSLMAQLSDAGLVVCIETSGAHDINGIDPRVHIVMDLKCPGSGEVAGNHWPNLDALKPSDEIKFVVAGKTDFDWAQDTIFKHRLDRRCNLLFSPVWDVVTPHELSAWLLDSGIEARLQLQIHKYIWDPQQRGV
jgi:7-carboxy-7-deazaguanine synthase